MENSLSQFDHTQNDCTCSGKRCTRCSIVQCLGAFHRYKNSPDGHRTLCKICRKVERETDEFKAKRREHHRENADHINEKKREWYSSNTEKALSHAKKSREKNIGRIRTYGRQYNSSERGRERVTRYRTNHPERVKQFSNNWKTNHPDEVKENHQVTSANYKARQLGIEGSITVEQWRALKDYYDHTCLRCKRQEPDIHLTIDHVVSFYYRGVNDISNIQPLCRFCNTSKGKSIIDYR